MKRMALACVLLFSSYAFAEQGKDVTKAVESKKVETKAATETAKDNAKTADKAQKSEKAKTTTAAKPQVVMETSLGKIVIELDAEKAPESTKNFLAYVNDKYYDNTVFHRVIDNFMIQGGGFALSDAGLEQKDTKKAIKNEGKNGLKNLRGTIAMARTADPDSATSQFFINVTDNAALDYPQPDGHGYAVFGKVVSGMDIVDKIKVVKTGVKNVKAKGMDNKVREVPFRDVPEQHVVIKSARVVEGKQGKS